MQHEMAHEPPETVMRPCSICGMPFSASGNETSCCLHDKPDEFRPIKVIDTEHMKQQLFRFPNGYGASVARSLRPVSSMLEFGQRGCCRPSRYFSYVSNEEEWEIAVIRFAGADDKWKIVYDTPISCDVVGYVHDTEVVYILDQIAALPSPGGDDETL